MNNTTIIRAWEDERGWKATMMDYSPIPNMQGGILSFGGLEAQLKQMGFAMNGDKWTMESGGMFYGFKRITDRSNPILALPSQFD